MAYGQEEQAGRGEMDSLAVIPQYDRFRKYNHVPLAVVRSFLLRLCIAIMPQSMLHKKAASLIVYLVSTM